MPSLDDLKRELTNGKTHPAAMYPIKALSTGPFGGMMIMDVAAGRAFDTRRRDVKFVIGGNETYEEWFQRVKLSAPTR